jgi:hypothetical protein
MLFFIIKNSLAEVECESQADCLDLAAAQGYDREIVLQSGAACFGLELSTREEYYKTRVCSSPEHCKDEEQQGVEFKYNCTDPTAQSLSNSSATDSETVTN